MKILYHIFCLALACLLLGGCGAQLKGPLTFNNVSISDNGNGTFTVYFSYGSEDGTVSSFYGIAQFRDEWGTVYHSAKQSFSVPNAGTWYYGDFTFSKPQASAMPWGTYDIILFGSSDYSTSFNQYYPSGTIYASKNFGTYTHTGDITNAISLSGIDDSTIVLLGDELNWQITIDYQDWVDFNDHYLTAEGIQTSNIYYGLMNGGITPGTHTINDQMGRHNLKAEIVDEEAADDVTVCALYDWDADNDGLSDATETNNANDSLNFNVNSADVCPSCAVGTPTNGSLTNGINLTNYGTGYYHYLGTDAVDTDDYGTCQTVELIEHVGRNWYCWHKTASGPRFQVGDLSLKNGGYWPDHGSHQNGLDFDARYLKSASEGPCDLSTTDWYQYSEELTIALIDLIVNSGLGSDYSVQTILVGQYSNLIDNAELEELIGTGIVQYYSGHENHFHVRLVAPPCN